MVTNKINEKEILSYFLNLNCETIKEEKTKIGTIELKKKFDKITLNFQIVNLQNSYTLQVVLPELDNKILTIFKIEFYDDNIDIPYIHKYLFFAVKGMKIFLNNYDSIIKQIRDTNVSRDLIISSLKDRVYLDDQIFQEDIIIGKLFENYSNEEHIEKCLVNQDNINNFYFNHTYPRTGRLNLCQCYKGTNIDINKLELLQIINLKTMRGTVKEFLVISLNKFENTAIVIENNKVYKLNEVIINDNDLIYLASESDLSSAYSALFMSNRLLCKNWKNSRLMSLN